MAVALGDVIGKIGGDGGSQVLVDDTRVQQIQAYEDVDVQVFQVAVKAIYAITVDIKSSSGSLDTSDCYLDVNPDGDRNRRIVRLINSAYNKTGSNSGCVVLTPGSFTLQFRNDSTKIGYVVSRVRVFKVQEVK